MNEVIHAGGPEVARLRLRASIRKYRAVADRTQKDAAGDLGWSPSKLLRLEQGKSPITPADTRALLSLYGVTDLAVIESHVEMAKQACKRPTYEEASDIATREYRELMGLEMVAKVIYKYEPLVIPGLFQTADYARNLLRALGVGPDKLERQVELRMLRQANVLESESRPELNFIIGESALRMKIGSDEVMLEQFDRLLELAKDSNTSLLAFPLAAGAHPRIGTAFTIFQFEDDDDLPDMRYLEGPAIETVSNDDPEVVQFYRELFTDLNERAKFPSFSDQLADIRRLYSPTDQKMD